MHILRVHNRYQQRGGEEAVFESEVSLLREHGDIVRTIEVTNDIIDESPSPFTSATLALTTIWSKSGRRLVTAAVSEFGPDIVHFDNTFPLISPGAYGAARRHGAAVVQTLHNYRLVCPSAILFRDGSVCEDCLGKMPLPGVVHACYRQSRTQSAAVASMLTAHRLRRTWTRDVDRYIAPTEFAKQKLLSAGLPGVSVSVKPHFVDRPLLSNPSANRDGMLFVGRLSREKGIDTLLDAVPHLDFNVDIKVVGDGPMMVNVVTSASANPMVKALGVFLRTNVQHLMASAVALIVPSNCYETFGLTIVEAFACGTPVIASRLGAMAEIVDDGRTGLLFDPGNVQDLAAKMRWAHDHPGDMMVMGNNARQEYDLKYTPDRNYALLMDIYEQAIHHARNR